MQNKNEFWLEQDGVSIVLNNHQHILKVSNFQAIYPYEHESLQVVAEPVDKTTEYYRSAKRQLKDDWCIDVLGSFETECEVLNQISQ